MAMWLTIFVVAMIVCLAGVIFLINGISRLSFMRKLSQNHKGRGYFFSLLILAVTALIFTFSMGLTNAIIVLIYLALIWLITELITHRFLSRDIRGYLAIGITAVFLFASYLTAHHVVETDYQISTDKDVEKLRIVQIADVHISALMDGEDFSEAVHSIQESHPDLLLITGDIVDSDTKEEDLIACCKALSEVKTTYGVFFAFGNHDKSYGASELNQMDGSLLIEELTQNGVTVLQDETVPIGEHYYLLGRRDASDGSRFGSAREEIGNLVASLDPKRFLICMDHQPNDYDSETAAGVDLVLSGHTHGGQMIPIRPVGVWIGANDRTYGYEERGNSKFIVTSGLSDWEIQFKSGCKAEYVVIDIEKAP